MPVSNKKQMLMLMGQRAKGLRDRILDCGGRRIAICDGPNGTALDFYSVGTRVVIVQEFAHHGVEMFVSDAHIQIKDLFAEIERIAAEGR